jgi:hypothetical protein
VGSGAAPPRRQRGEGWEAWLEDGLVWTRDTLSQHALAAEARTRAMAELLAAGAHGVLIDDRKPAAGADSDGARDVYAAFLRAHRGVPIAVVTTDPDAIRMNFDLRAKADARLQVFPTLQAAKAWLKKEAKAR